MPYLYYILLAIALFIVEILYIRLARRWKIGSHAVNRSSHSGYKLSGGGIIFIIAALIVWACPGFPASHYSLPDGFALMMGCALLLAVMSFVDDMRDLSPGLRLFVQLVTVALAFHSYLVYSRLDIFLLILICGVGFINAYNFMDGINGITGAYSIAILIPLAIVNSRIGFIDRSMIYIIGISVLVFCIFNFRKRARCFAGDVGSVSIAFILLFMLGALIMATGQVWYLIFFAVYGVDSVLTIIHRLMLHENIFKPHRKHAYQIMANELGMPHTLVSTIYSALQTTISLGALYLHINEWVYFISVIVVLSVGYTVFQRKYFHLHLEYLKSKNKL